MMSSRYVPVYSFLFYVTFIVIKGSYPASLDGHETDKHFAAEKVPVSKEYTFNDVLRLQSGSTTPTDSLECYVCKTTATALQTLIAQKRSKEDMVKIVSAICKEAKLHDDRICDYMTREYMGMAVGVVQRLVLDPDEICGFYLGPPCATPYDPTGMWNITLPDTPKPPVKPHIPPSPSSPKMKFLQLTDIHFDLMYEPGSDAECGEPLCCRSNDGKPAPGVAGAGRWGDYRGCDIPLTLVDNLFQNLATIKNEFDFIIFTGDISAHDVWNQSRSDQISALDILVSYFDKYLPKMPVYFCVGNHDTAPEGSFPPPFITGNDSQTWMYEAMFNNWGRFLPADTKETILRGGFYTVSPYPGFRIISINSVFCYPRNWWLLINTTDPAGELTWMAQTLQSAEDKGEKVFILSHIPSDCMKAWSWNYYRIISRYESTVVGQFNGHTHTDEFKMYYDVHNLTRPVNVAFVGGSVTTISDKNPNYRIYTMDGVYANSSYAVLDYEDYIFDLRKNTGANVSWELEYSPLADYNMKTLYPSDWNNLIYRMKNDDDLFQKFYVHINKKGVSPPCTGSCKTKTLCGLKSGRSDDPQLCQDL